MLSVGGEGRKFSSPSLQAMNAGKRERDRIKAVIDFSFFINTSLKNRFAFVQERCYKGIKVSVNESKTSGRYADLQLGIIAIKNSIVNRGILVQKPKITNGQVFVEWLLTAFI